MSASSSSSSAYMGPMASQIAEADRSARFGSLPYATPQQVPRTVAEKRVVLFHSSTYDYSISTDTVPVYNKANPNIIAIMNGIKEDVVITTNEHRINMNKAADANAARRASSADETGRRPSAQPKPAPAAAVSRSNVEWVFMHNDMKDDDPQSVAVVVDGITTFGDIRTCAIAYTADEDDENLPPNPARDSIASLKQVNAAFSISPKPAHLNPIQTTMDVNTLIAARLNCRRTPLKSPADRLLLPIPLCHVVVRSTELRDGTDILPTNLKASLGLNRVNGFGPFTFSNCLFIILNSFEIGMSHMPLNDAGAHFKFDFYYDHNGLLVNKNSTVGAGGVDDETRKLMILYNKDSATRLEEALYSGNSFDVYCANIANKAPKPPTQLATYNNHEAADIASFMAAVTRHYDGGRIISEVMRLTR